jgi:hypothetical protein
MFMPFRSEFDDVAKVLKECVSEAVNDLYKVYGFHLPEINRVDWVKEAGVIHGQLWRELINADIIFCDISGYNPNVMFELGVAAGWKRTDQVVLLKSKEVKQDPAFDISPIRYFEYDPSNLRSKKFTESIKQVTQNVAISFPDGQIPFQNISLPLNIDFSSGYDDGRLYTPPFCHRRIREGIFEFGSLFSYPHSWASIGNLNLQNVKVSFKAKFIDMLEENPKIGIAVRSQHFYANFGHVLVLGADGSIFITQPNNEPPQYYSDITLRGPTNIRPNDLHEFEISINEESFIVKIDDFSEKRAISEMPRVNGPGLVRFHATRAWMGIESLSLSAA